MAKTRKPPKKGCRYGFWDGLYGCPKKPCKHGPRYPNAYVGTCPKESAEQKAARKRLADEAKRKAKEEEQRRLADANFGNKKSGANGSNGAGMMYWN